MSKLDELNENIRTDRSDLQFKAKDKNGNWRFGGYCRMAETTYCTSTDYERNPVQVHHYIQEDLMIDWGLPDRMNLVEIDPATLCRCVGISDVDGKIIFENDILRGPDRQESPSHGGIAQRTGIVRFGAFSGTSGGIHLGFYIKWQGEESGLLHPDILWWADKCRVVGNVFD